MRIIIAGDGKMGQLLTKKLSGEGHDLTLIDNNPDALESTIERYDVMSVVGNCASMEVLRNAGVENADLLITATGQDELNLLCCMTAHGMNPDLHTIARIRTPDYTESTYAMRKMFALSLTVNPDRLVAREIGRLLRYPGFLKREMFANGMVEIVELKVDEASILCNRKLSELPDITHCQVLVCAVLRNGKSVTPAGDFELKSGDRIFVTASTNNLSQLLKSTGVTKRKIRNVVVAGGGRGCFYLTKLLLKDNISVKIIEKDRNRCEELAELLPEATIVQGDVSVRAVLERENVSGADVVVAMTGMDELNVFLALYAINSSNNNAKVITKLGRGENMELIDRLSLGSIVSPKELCSSTIATYVRAMNKQVGAAVTVHSIADGQADAIEFIVDNTTKYTGVALKDVPIRKNVLVASIMHDRSIIFPKGDSVFQAGDRIVLVSSADVQLQHLNDAFL